MSGIFCDWDGVPNLSSSSCSSDDCGSLSCSVSISEHMGGIAGVYGTLGKANPLVDLYVSFNIYGSPTAPDLKNASNPIAVIWKIKFWSTDVFIGSFER